MRGQGSLQQLLGKRIGSNKKSEDADVVMRGSHARLDSGDMERLGGSVQAQRTGEGPQQAKLTGYLLRLPRSRSAQQPITDVENQELAVSARISVAAADAAAPAPTAQPDGYNSNMAWPAPVLQQPQDIQQPYPAAPLGRVTLVCRVVGRLHRGHEPTPPAPDERLWLQREPDNPVDPCAVQVCSSATVSEGDTRRVHGHLPASVAAQLAPLLDACDVSVCVQRADTQSACVKKPRDSAGGGDGDGGGNSGSSSGDGNSSGSWCVSLQLDLTPAAAARPDAAAALQAVAEAATAALQPSRNSGSVLADAFDELLQAARQHDAHLLDEDEQATLSTVQSLPSAARCLLLRLLLRRRTWFALQSLAGCCPDVPDPSAAAEQLVGAQLAVWAHTGDSPLDGLLQELPVPVLRQLLPMLLPRGHPAVASAFAASAGTSGAGTKSALVAAVQANGCLRRLQAALARIPDAWLRVCPHVATAFARLQRLYFLNPGQDMGMFLAVDRRVLRYPAYTLRRSRPVFANRAALLAYEDALANAAGVEDALQAGDLTCAWTLLQPALDALQQGSHKSVVWAQAHGAVMPNPPPTCSTRIVVPSLKSGAATSGQQEWQQGSAAEQALLEAAAMQQRQRQLWRQQQEVLQQQLRQQYDECADSFQIPLDVAQQQQQKCKEKEGEEEEEHGYEQQHQQQLTTEQHPSTRASSPRPRSRDSYGRGDVDHTRSVSPSPSSCTCSDAAPAEAVSSSSSSLPCSSARATASSPAPRSASSSSSNSKRSKRRQQRRRRMSVLPHAAPFPVECTVDAAPAVDAGTALLSPQPLFLARFCAGWVHASLGTVAVSLLERRRDWGAAAELLRLLLGGNACPGRRGEWWERLAINLEHVGDTEQALEAVESALADSWVRAGDLLGLQRRLLRLGKPPRRWKRPGWAPQAEWEPRERGLVAQPLPNPTGTKSRFLLADGTALSVEELALAHYASPEGGGWRGLHSEGGVWAMLFGLLLWDQIFMDVPDVFRSRFQVAPLDLDSDAFYPARRAALDQRLADIADGHAPDILCATWARHAGNLARGVSWSRFDRSLLLEVVQCVGGLGLAAVLRLMAEDHAGAAGGLPDLLLWRPDDHIARVVEVKGPRDRLSNQQRFWLAHMAASTIDVEVCKVREPRQ